MPRPYQQYLDEAREASDRKYKKWLIPLMLLGAAIGAAIGGGFSDGRLDAIVAGVAGGGMVGLAVQYIIRRTTASENAEDAFRADWCSEHGCVVIETFEPANGPYANSGHRQRSSDAIHGPMNGLNTVLYNFSYWTKQQNSKGGSSETEHPYKIFCIEGPRLPIASMSFGRRDVFNRLRVFDKIDAAVSSQRGVELESIDFNKTFDLEIHDHADDIWIRRVFDPPTIDALVRGTFEIPDIRYYDNVFWLVESGHYDAPELDKMLDWQGRAARAIAHLARVPA
ncbi:MAG: hypothetical protein HZB14_07515 [Actinobacteria bacterium]|nr:hypothetical protein [Actinomycetota bacterium]